MEKTICHNNFKEGVRDGIPIALGYLSVSLTIGMAAVSKGLPVWSAILISITNLTSAGEVAGIGIIAAQGSFFEMALTQFIVNLRYALMSLSWSQKMDPSVTMPERFLVAYGNTDEIFAVSSAKKGTLGAKYLLGLILLPFIGWTVGTALGALISDVLPVFMASALTVGVYGMFICILVNGIRESKEVLLVVAISVAISCLFYYLPMLKSVGSGFVIIIAAVIAAGFGACFFPIKEEPISLQEECHDHS